MDIMIGKYEERMNTLLITGAAGFLGSALTEKFLKNGYKVIGIDRKGKGFLKDKSLSNENFTFLEFDINNNFIEILKDFNINCIFHLASIQPFSRDLNYNDFYSGNVETTLEVINFARVRKVKLIVYASTVNIFGKQFEKKYINEESISFPTNHYTLTKYISEKLLEIELKNSNTKVAIIRYPSIFGKNHLEGVIYTYYKLTKNEHDIEVYGKGEKYRNFLYVEDAFDILLKVIKNVDKLEKFELFIAGSKNSIKMIEVVQIMKKLLNSNSQVIPVDNPPSPDRDIFIDISKAQRILNYNPFIIEEGLKLYIEEMRNEI